MSVKRLLWSQSYPPLALHSINQPFHQATIYIFNYLILPLSQSVPHQLSTHSYNQVVILPLHHPADLMHVTLSSTNHSANQPFTSSLTLSLTSHSVQKPPSPPLKQPLYQAFLPLTRPTFSVSGLHLNCHPCTYSNHPYRRLKHHYSVIPFCQ